MDMEGVAKKRKRTAPKKKKLVNLEGVKDVFNLEILLDIKTDTCAMCRGNHEDGVRTRNLMDSNLKAPIYDDCHESDEDEGGIIYAHEYGDVTGIWASRYSVNRHRTFVHYHCALSSGATSFDGAVWRNLLKEIQRSRSMACKECKLSGASLGCSGKPCRSEYHIPCAVANGYRKTHSGQSFLCPVHVEKARQKQLEEDQLVPPHTDLTKGQEKLPVNFQNNTEDGAILPGHNFEYCKVNLDSDEVISHRDVVKGTRDKGCCSCVEFCNDSTCECLLDADAEYQKEQQERGWGQGRPQVRNYSQSGLLMAPPRKRIVECSIMCDCSMRRCENRVVERGSLFKLEVFRLPHSDRKLPDKSQGSGKGAVGEIAEDSRWGWGVRTLEFIKKDSFVCELTGQLLLGESKPMHQDSEGFFRGGLEVADLLTGTNPKDAGRILHNLQPVGAWEMKRLSPLRWAAEQLVNSKKVEPLYREKAGEKAGEKEDPASGPSHTEVGEEAAVGIDVGQGQMEATSMAAGSIPSESSMSSAAMSAPVTSALSGGGGSVGSKGSLNLAEVVKQNLKAVREFLKGELCIDSRYFGSTGSFIRLASQLPTSKPGGAMLVRRLVYSNREALGAAGSSVSAMAGPRLAFFAAKDIEAGTELLQ